MRHIPREAALLALEFWNGDASSLEYLSTSGNTVYRYREAGEPRILRLTDAGHRVAEQNLAEMLFLTHLTREGVRACSPVPSVAGELVEQVGDCSASVLTWASGTRVDRGSEFWNEVFFREWGRSLATIHRASQSYRGPDRWEWWEEGLIVDAGRLFPTDDTETRAEFDEVMTRLLRLPRNPGTYGMIHADFAPQNFHYNPIGGITSFDFGNCCQHWFVSDLAISLSTLRGDPDREDYRRWILAGYEQVFPVDRDIWEELSWFLRLRILYVYLSRLRKFGSNPSEAERAILEDLRAKVAERFTWP